MFCSSCGTKIEEGAKFCGGCGAQTSAGPNTSAQPAQNQGYQTSAATVSSPANQNEYVDKAKDVSKQFYQFALQALKGPFKACRQVNEANKINGIISLVLFAFFLPMFSYLITKSVSRGVGSFTGTSPNVPFGSFVIQPFFYVLIFFAVFVAVNLAVGKMMKVEISYVSVLAKYGSLMILPVLGVLISNLFILLSMVAIGTFFFSISLTLFILASFTLLFTINAEKTTDAGLDVYYGLILTNIVMLVFYLVIGMSIMDRIVGELQSGPLGFFM